MNVQLYVPVGVAAFTMIKPDAPADSPEDTDLFNGELLAIQSAFDQIHDLPLAPANSVDLTAQSRNVLVDLSPLKNGGLTNFVVVTLPPHPAVGDPPCFVIVQESGYQDDNVSNEAVVIVTTNDDYPIDDVTPSPGLTRINGLTPDNVGYTNQIALFNPGDLARFTYIGPSEGWHVHTNLSIVGNPDNQFRQQAAGTLPWPEQHLQMGASSPMTLLPIAVYRPGEWFALISTGANLFMGDNTYRFNGVPGPLFVSSYHRKRFTCLGAKIFSVQSG